MKLYLIGYKIKDSSYVGQYIVPSLNITNALKAFELTVIHEEVIWIYEQPYNDKLKNTL